MYRKQLIKPTFVLNRFLVLYIYKLKYIVFKFYVYENVIPVAQVLYTIILSVTDCNHHVCDRHTSIVHAQRAWRISASDAYLQWFIIYCRRNEDEGEKNIRTAKLYKRFTLTRVVQLNKDRPT